MESAHGRAVHGRWRAYAKRGDEFESHAAAVRGYYAFGEKARREGEVPIARAGREKRTKLRRPVVAILPNQSSQISTSGWATNCTEWVACRFRRDTHFSGKLSPHHKSAPEAIRR